MGIREFVATTAAEEGWTDATIVSVLVSVLEGVVAQRRGLSADDVNEMITEFCTGDKDGRRS